jgi:hypothetical protein
MPFQLESVIAALLLHLLELGLQDLVRVQLSQFAVK